MVTPARVARRDPGREPQVFRIRATAIGETARSALALAGGTARPLAVHSDSAWVEAARQMLWIGAGSVPLHPRAILAEVPAIVDLDGLAVDVTGAPVWKPAGIPTGRSEAHTLVAGAASLIGDLPPHPAGLGALLAGGAPSAPLDGAGGAVRTLAAACGADDAGRALGAARTLLGVGPGLTPSGDDLVGGAFLARTVLAAAGLADHAGWARAARSLHAAALDATHPISAVLLGDMLAVDTWGPLHSLLAALSRGAPSRVVGQSVNDLTKIGGTSGWDMLTGLLAGLLGAHAFPRLG